MKFSYYPGCTLKTQAQELDLYARRSAEALGVQLEELPEWQCCGGVYPLGRDEIATRLSSVRALCAARDLGNALVTVCSACHHVIKRVNHDMRYDAEIADKVNAYCAFPAPYHGETQVVHYLEMLRDCVGFDALKKAVVHPLKGRKIAPYYGCLLLRPGTVMAMDDPENPGILEDFLRALGATPVYTPQRNECCGGYVTLEDRALAQKKSRAIVDSAAQAGADCIITACPLCRYNLAKNGGGGLPVVYFTQLLAEALGVL